MTVNLAISSSGIATQKGGITILPSSPRPKGGITILPSSPRPKGGITILPSSPRP